MITKTLRNHLLTFTDLTTKIGDRVYANRAPQSASPPYVILSRVAGQVPYSLAGEVGKTQTVVQCSVWARDPNGAFQADQIAELIRDKISGDRGTWDSDTFVSACLLQGEPNDYADEAGDASADVWHTVQMDFQITHERSVPTLA